MDERLRLAGYSGRPIFKGAALELLCDVSGGVPRVINIVCDGALLLGFARGKQVLGADEIREVARDLGLLESEAPTAGTRLPVETPERRRGGLFGLFRARPAGGT